MSVLTAFTGGLKLDLNGTEVVIKPRKHHKFSLLELREQKKETDLKEVDKILTEILKESISDATKEEIDDVLAQHSDRIYEELHIFYGWITRDKLNQLKLDAEKKNRESQEKTDKGGLSEGNART